MMVENVEQKLAHDYTDAVFVGLGGCGTNTIARLRRSGIKGNKTVIVERFSVSDAAKLNNVSYVALLERPADPGYYRLPLSPDERDHANKLLKIELAGAKKVLLFAGLGGFTGTGLAPIAAAVAKAEGAQLGMVITYPFKLEKKRREIADKNFPNLQSMADDFLMRRNDDLVTICPDSTIADAFVMQDDALAEEIKGKGR